MICRFWWIDLFVYCVVIDGVARTRSDVDGRKNLTITFEAC
jgi:hypothetical protein